MSTEPTVGAVAKFLESKRGDPVTVDGFQMRWGMTLRIEDTGDWTVLDEADWFKALNGRMQ